MDQSSARKRAKEMGGIAVSARRSPRTGKWITGGWATTKDEWIVVSALDGFTVWDDRPFIPEYEDK